MLLVQIGSSFLGGVALFSFDILGPISTERNGISTMFNSRGFFIDSINNNQFIIWPQVILIELAISFFLQLVYLFFSENKTSPDNYTGFAVGSVFGVAMISSGMLSGGVCNVSRVIGPLLLHLKIKLTIVYLVSSVLGSFGGYLMYRYLLTEEPKPSSQ